METIHRSEGGRIVFTFLQSKEKPIECCWVAHAVKAANNSKIAPNLFVALILNESSGNALATRWERKFFIRYISDKPLESIGGNQPRDIDFYQEQAERLARAYSWGLCQVMGQTAREFGFRGRYLWELLDVDTNVKLGAQIFAHKRERVIKTNPLISEAETERLTLLAYNGGADLEYPDRVIKRIPAASALVKKCG